MKGYRNIYRCPECKKIGAKLEDLTNDVCLAFTAFNRVVLCKHCGKVVKLEQLAGKPKLIGLLGWDIKEKKLLGDTNVTNKEAK